MNTDEFIDNVIMNITGSEIAPMSKSDLQCAPGKEYEAGSCISLVILEEMCRAYNIMADEEENKIVLSSNMSVLNPQKYKIYLIYELGRRIGDKCETQKCWSKQDFIFQMNEAAKTELLKYTFKPDSPQGKFEWLSTFDINDSMEQYEKINPEFKFFGAIPMDFEDLPGLEINRIDYEKLHNDGKSLLGVIFNLDDHYDPGSHWVGMYTNLDKGHIFYYDSFGVKPEKRVRSLMRKQTRYLIDKRGFDINDVYINYNKKQHQKQNSECGVYSMSFILRMVREDHKDILREKNGENPLNPNGEFFEQLCNTPISDNEINKCRKKYFDPYIHK